MKTKLLSILAALACVHVRPDSQDEITFKLACADLQAVANTIEGEIQNTVDVAVEMVADSVTESREKEFHESLMDAAALSEKATAERAANIDAISQAMGGRLAGIETKNEELSGKLDSVNAVLVDLFKKLQEMAAVPEPAQPAA